MAPATPTYDLMLVLSTSAEEDRRKQILSEVRSAISAGGGAIEREDDWGVRRLSYRIAHQADGEYHLWQFTGPPPLLESLRHSLRIADGVLRFRIVKQIPGTPAPPDSPPPVLAAVAASRAGDGAGAGTTTDAGEPDAQPAGAAGSEAPDATEGGPEADT